VQLFNSVAGGLHGLYFMATEVVPGVLHFLESDFQGMSGFVNSGAVSHGRRRWFRHHDSCKNQQSQDYGERKDLLHVLTSPFNEWNARIFQDARFTIVSSFVVRIAGSSVRCAASPSTF
jgi:hypothetical protein